MNDKPLSRDGLLADGSQQLDTNGRPITPRRRRWGMNVNILCAALGTLFAVGLWPGSTLFTLFMQGRLQASLTQIGFFAAIGGLGQVVQLLGVYIFDRTRTRKFLWTTLTLLYRAMGFVTIGFAIWFHYHQEANPDLRNQLIWLMLMAMALGFTFSTICSNAWWSWIADLAPESVRGRFFGNRQLAAGVATLLGYLPVVLLDIYGKDASGHYTVWADAIFIGIFILCTLSGMADIIIHAFIPEPARQDRPDSITLGATLRSFVEPMKDPCFRRFTLGIALSSMAVMIWSPFVWPYLTAQEVIAGSDQGIRLKYYWLFISVALSTLAMLASSRYWGLLIDRFGSKPVLVITYFAGLTSAYLLFITTQNAALLVCIVSIIGGFLWGGMGLANAQLMLTLSPQKSRNSYLAVYATLTGITLFLAPMAAGWFGEWVQHKFDDLPFYYVLPTGTVLTYIQVLVVIGIAWRLAVLPLLLSVREGSEKPIGVVLATVTGAGQFRTLYSMRMIAGRDSTKKLSVLRGMSTQSDQLAVEDLIAQLDDADPHVRREAAMALGRIGGSDAVEALVNLLNHPQGDLQAEAAIALGTTGDPRAIRPLLEKLNDPNEIVREHVAEALGELQSTETGEALMNLLKTDESSNVFGRGAQALAKLGVMDAAWEILPRLHRTENVGLRRQLAMAMGDLLGRHGRFYDLMNDEFRKPGSRTAGLVRGIGRRLRHYARTRGTGLSKEQARQLLEAGEQVKTAERALGDGQYKSAIGQMQATVMTLLRSLYEFTGQDELAVEFALSRGSRLGVGLWILQGAADYSRQPDCKRDVLHLYTLLGLHFIYEFTGRWDKSNPRRPWSNKLWTRIHSRMPLLGSGRRKLKKLAGLRHIDRSSDPSNAVELTDLLDDAEPQVRREATLALGRLGGAAAVDALIAMVNDPACDLQAEAALALGTTGDPRAVEPLLLKLHSDDDIVREHAAQALGELHEPRVAEALMGLLQNDPSPNVFGRASLALARFGVADAIWKIVPRMHQMAEVAISQKLVLPEPRETPEPTSDLGLPRQLATAVGDLIGQPGTFYYLLNDELRKPGNYVIKIAGEAVRTPRAEAKRLQVGRQAERAPHLLIAAQHIELAIEEFEYLRYDLALGQELTAAEEILRALGDLKSSDEVTAEAFLDRSPRLGVGLWFLKNAIEYLRNSRSNPEIRQLDTLLGFHFLRWCVESMKR